MRFISSETMNICEINWNKGNITGGAYPETIPIYDVILSSKEFSGPLDLRGLYSMGHSIKCELRWDCLAKGNVWIAFCVLSHHRMKMIQIFDETNSWINIQD